MTCMTHALLILMSMPGAQPDTLSKVVLLPEIVVSTARADALAPIAKTVLGRDELLRLNWGQDTPMALATLPGAYAYSDAGNGIGYSYLSLRGFPQRRISVLINGVPLNDPESHEVYWIDHPDLLASTSEVQVQRGVGSALYGAASLGGSVNLETSPFAEVAHLTTTVAYGSFETKRFSIEGGSGALANGWSTYARYSRIETQGYRDDSFTKLWSYMLSARRLLDNQSFRVNLYGGPEETHLAYLGVLPDYLEGAVTGDRRRDRRFNPITYENERDHFFEPHYELIHSWAPRPGLTLSQTLFFFDGKGYYDERRLGERLSDYRLSPWATYDPTLFGADSITYYRDADGNGTLDRDSQGRVTVEGFDMVRRRTVANRHYGWVPRLRLEHPGGTLILGGELRAHDGRHWGEVIGGSGMPPRTEPDHVYYDYHPRTLAAGLFAREEWSLAPALTATGDLAWRHQSYAMRGDQFDGIRFDQSYDFALPRLGITYAPRPSFSAYASWAASAREPAFRDLYDAEGAGSVPLYRVADVAQNIYRDPLVRPEHVNDYEVGAAWRGEGLSLEANLFHMGFRDELVNSGQFNTDLGYAILGNAAQTRHQGLELSGRIERPLARGVDGRLDMNASLSRNRIVSYREFITVPGVTTPDSLVELNDDGNRLGFFPDAMGNLSAGATWNRVSLAAEVQSASRICLDNAEDRSASLPPRTVVNLVGGVRWPWGEDSQAEISIRVNNLTDVLYETGGYTYYYAGVKYAEFIPAATRNVLAQVRVEF